LMRFNHWSHVLPGHAWLTARGAGAARTRSTSTMPPVAGTASIIAAAQDCGAATGAYWNDPWCAQNWPIGRCAYSIANTHPSCDTLVRTRAAVARRTSFPAGRD
jgi:hypothetical protein